MGIKGLNKAIKDTASESISILPIDKLTKGVYGVDVSIYLYPGLYNQENKGKGSHIRKFLELITNWRMAGHNLVMVFDGNTHDVEAKCATISKRRNEQERKHKIIMNICNDVLKTNKQQLVGSNVLLTPDIIEVLNINVKTLPINDYAHKIINNTNCTDEQVIQLDNATKNNITIKSSDIEDLVNLFKYTNTPYLTAKGEADHLLADLYQEGMIDGVISEDGDMLTHGVKVLIRGINDSTCRRAGVVKQYELDKLLNIWNINYEQFVDVCILAGCDYCTDKIKGVACKTALKLIRQYGSVESYIDNLNEKQLHTVPDGFIEKYRAAALIFCNSNDLAGFTNQPRFSKSLIEQK